MRQDRTPGCSTEDAFSVSFARTGASGAKTYILRKRQGGKVVNLTLGRHGPQFGLADARRQARDILVDAQAGKTIAPRAMPASRAQQVDSVAVLFRQFYLQHGSLLRSAREVRRIFGRYILPVLGARSVSGLTRHDIIQLVDKVVYANPARPTPNQGKAVLAQLSSFLSWCVAKDVAAANVCHGVRKPVIRGPRDRTLADEELAAVWQAAALDGFPFGYAVQMLILNGARRAEVFGASWPEFDLDERLWTIPAQRAKNGVTHGIPLSDAAVAILYQLPSRVADSRAGIVGIYQRHQFGPEKRAALDAWGRWVSDLVGGKA